MGADVDSQKKVLIVEDDAAISALLAAVLEAEGLDALPVYDGEAAVSLAHEVRPDLITLDLALPKKDGLQVLRDLEAAEDTSRIPVIVVSAFTSSLSADARHRVEFVVGKPFEVDDLLGKVRCALRGRA